MMLTPTEIERLTIFTAAELARKRRAKGLTLNHPEATALISDEILSQMKISKKEIFLLMFSIPHQAPPVNYHWCLLLWVGL